MRGKVVVATVVTVVQGPHAHTVSKSASRTRVIGQGDRRLGFACEELRNERRGGHGIRFGTFQKRPERLAVRLHKGVTAQVFPRRVDLNDAKWFDGFGNDNGAGFLGTQSVFECGGEGLLINGNGVGFGLLGFPAAAAVFQLLSHQSVGKEPIHVAGKVRAIVGKGKTVREIVARFFVPLQSLSK